VREAFADPANRCMKFTGFIKGCAITALKQSLYVDFFFKGRLYTHIRNLLATDPFDCRQLIDDSIWVAQMVFAQPEEHSHCILQTDTLRIAYDAVEDVYFTSRIGGAIKERQSFATTRALLDGMEALSPSTWIVQGYNFEPRVRKLLQVLLEIETRADSTRERACCV
jgi:hypothetical protein